jgi:hypothetical protein
MFEKPPQGIVSLDQLRAELQKEDRTHILKRSPEVEARYTIHKAKLSRLYPSLEEYIKQTILKGQFYCITHNQFPYIHSPDLAHLVFWTDKLSLNQAKKRMIDFELIPEEAFVIWENYLHTRSLKNLKHYQIIMLKKYSKLYV